MRTLSHYLLMLSLLVGLSCESTAGELIGVDDIGLFNVSWTPLQLGIFPGLQLFGKSDTCGLSLFLLADSGSTNNYGMQIAPLILRRKCNYGLSMAIFSLFGENNYGMQLALITYGKENKGAAVGFYTVTQVNNGLQLGILTESVSRTETASRSNFGVQIGMYNKAESGLQFGLLNYNPNANIKYLPFFNYLKPL